MLISAHRDSKPRQKSFGVEPIISSPFRCPWFKFRPWSSISLIAYVVLALWNLAYSNRQRVPDLVEKVYHNDRVVSN